MASYFEAFKNLKKRAMELKVQFPPEVAPSGTPGTSDYFEGLKPQIEFTVKRLNQIQHNNAFFAGEAHLHSRGYTAANPTYTAEKNASVNYKLSEHLIPHIVDWKSLDDTELPPFNKDEAKAFIESLGFYERVFLGQAYQKAEADDEKKSTGEASSAKAS